MKLRLRGNSLRLRLSQVDVARLCQEGCVRETTAFGLAASQQLGYTVTVSDASAGLQASYDATGIQITIPTAMALQLHETELVSLEGVQPLGDGQSLRLQLEKDFRCGKPRATGEDEGTYAHPEADLRC